jgi:hypothetical protein
VQPNDLAVPGLGNSMDPIAAHATGPEQFVAGLAAMPATFLDPEAIAAMLVAHAPAGAVMTNPATRAVLAALRGKSPAIAAATERVLAGAAGGASFGGLQKVRLFGHGGHNSVTISRRKGIFAWAENAVFMLVVRLSFGWT